MRNLILEEGKRADGRGLTDVRPITSRCGLLPRAHGSALFTRGETQALAVTTLGMFLSMVYFFINMQMQLPSISSGCLDSNSFCLPLPYTVLIQAIWNLTSPTVMT